MCSINYYSLSLTMYIFDGRFVVLWYALLHWIQCRVFHCSSEALRVGIYGSNFTSAFHFSWPRMVLDWMSYNETFVWAQYRVVHCFFPFPIPSKVLGVGTLWSIFSSAFQFIIVSDVCGLDEILCALICEFNFKLFFGVPFPTPSEALGVGTWRS